MLFRGGETLCSLHHFVSVRSPSPSLLSQVRRRGRRRRQWGRRRGGRRRRRPANLRGRGDDLVCSPPPPSSSHRLRNASVRLSVLFSSLTLSTVTRCAVFLQIWNSGCTLCELRRTLPPYRLSRTATEGRAAPSGRIEEIGKEGTRKRRDGESISPRARPRWPPWKSVRNIS